MADEHTSSGSGDAGKSKKKGRGPTLMKKIFGVRGTQDSWPIDVDQDTYNVFGPNKSKFKSSLGMLARTKVPITIDHWDDVHEVIKHHIWSDVAATWDIPRTDGMRRKVMSIVGERWRHYKTELVNEYIYGPSVRAIPPNPTISEETWVEFVQKKTTPQHRDLREKHQAIARQNVAPHTLSRGGYERLRAAKLKEKAERRQQLAGDSTTSFTDPPSPPSRHELWNDARKKKGGEYTTEEAAEIAHRIEELQEQQSQGLFQPIERHDILTTEIGKPEHPGRVRAVGGGIGINLFFGRKGGVSPEATYQQRLAEMQAKYTQDLTQMAQTIKAQIMDEVEQRMQSQMQAQMEAYMSSFSQQQPTPPPHVSTGVSMWPPHPPHPAQKILLLLDGYVDAVAIGTTQSAASTVHHQILDDEWVRVSVDEVIHREAPLPSTTVEFMNVEMICIVTSLDPED